MWISALVSSAAVISFASASLEGLSAYVSPLKYNDFPRQLFKRQGCPGGYTNCGALGNSGACCPTDQLCTEDDTGNIACCPEGAACTGTLDGGVGTMAGPNTGPVLIGGPGGTAATSDPVSPSATGGFLFPSPTTTEGPSLPESTVEGAPFPFVYVPTTFADAAQCSSYATSCSDQYQSCLAALNGGVNGVTVSGAGVGITVPGASVAVPGASSICTSLSSVACYGLQAEICSQYGGDTAIESGGFVVSGGAMPRVTGCAGMVYAVGAGAMAGAAGVVI